MNEDRLDHTEQFGHKDFTNRVSELIADAGGSSYALGKVVGMPANTIRRYLTNSEPTRPYLIAIAHKTGVSLEWLATGAGPKILPQNNLSAGQSNVGSEIRERFRFLQIEPSEGLAKATGIAPQRLNEILTGDKDASAGELKQICQYAGASVMWLLDGIGFPQLKVTHSKLNEDRMGAWTSTKFQSLSMLYSDVAELLAPLPHLDFVSYQVKSDSMSSKINRGDVVIADRTALLNTEISGTFLVEERGAREVCYLSKDGPRVHFSYENAKIPSRVRDWAEHPAQFQILGRVIYRIALTNL